MKDTFKHQGLRQKLVRTIQQKGISDPRVLEAIGRVPRHLFMDSGFLDHAYQDKAFPIAAGQTISQPYTVAFQTELLQVKKGSKILEIGTGSGYQCAVLCEMGAKVYSIERQLELYKITSKFLPKLGYRPKKLIFGDGYKGLKEEAPFTGIIVTASKGGAATIDNTLMAMLKDLRKRNAKKLGVPPFVIFQDPSLEDMALKYPITLDELSNVHGVGEGKAKKYGKDFVALIANYVEEHDIVRPDDLVVKSTGTNSAIKLYIIQNIDRKLPLEDIANAKGMEMSDFIKEMEAIVYSGTKLNIDYCIDEILDEDQQEELHDYFMEAATDKISEAMEEFEGDYEDEELRLYRIKFISEVAN